MKDDAASVERPGPESGREAGRRSGVRLRVGLAVGPGLATAVVLPGGRRAGEGGAVHERPVGAPADDGSWPELAEFLREVREDAGARDGLLSLAVLRPLGHLKVLRLPPLRRGPLERMVALGAERFFPPAVGGLLTGLVRVAGTKEGVTASVAAAGARRVEAAVAAATEAGYAVENVTTGPAAALSDALTRCPALRRGRTALALRGRGGLELLCLDRGRLRIARSLPAGPADPAADPSMEANRVLAAIRETRDHSGYLPDRVVVAGMEAPQTAGSVDEVVISPVPELEGVTLEVLAACGAVSPSTDTPLLAGESQRLTARLRQRRRTAVLCALTAVVLAATGTLHLSQLREETEEVRTLRAQMRPAVSDALRVRGDIQAVRARVDAFAGLEAARPRWVELFAAVSGVLPEDAHLTSLVLSREELRLDGQARSAAALVPVFEAASWVESVRLGSPVRREQTPAGVRERFSLTLQLRSGGGEGEGPGESGGGAR